MPTNEERREVACRTRNVIDGPVHIDRLVNALGLAYAQGKLLGFYVSESSVRHLADLIEPEPERTCHLERHVEEREGRYVWVCTFSCGHGFEGYWYTNPRYCPFCGARVVDE